MKSYCKHIVLLFLLIVICSSAPTWESFVEHYQFKMRDGCESHDVRCIPVERVVSFDDGFPIAASMCCIPVCDIWEHEEHFYAPLNPALMHLCDFSESSSLGFVHFKFRAKAVEYQKRMEELRNLHAGALEQYANVVLASDAPSIELNTTLQEE